MEINLGSPKPQQNLNNQPSSAPQKQGMFSSGKNVPQISQNDKRFDEEISTISRRLKLLENSLSNLRKTTENLEKNTVEQQKENRRDIKILEEENAELKETIRTLKNTLKKIADDMANVARSDEVKVIKKYLDLWNPVKFTTPDMVTRIVREEIDNNHQMHIDSRIDSIQRDIYQKQELKDQIHKETKKDPINDNETPSLHKQFNPED